MKEPFGKFKRPAEQPVERVSSEKAARLATVHPELVGMIGELIVILEEKESGWVKHTDEQIKERREEIEGALKAAGIALKPSEGSEDVFDLFVQSFRDRASHSS